MRSLRLGWCVGLLVLVWPTAGWSQTQATRAAARELATDGVKRYQAGDYDGADDKLSRAFEVVKAPSIGLWSARALAKKGKLVEASERYLDVTRLDASAGDTSVQKQAQVDAGTEREALLKRIPNLLVEVTGAPRDGLTLTLDGVALPVVFLGARQPSNPGHHVIVAHHDDREVTRELDLPEGKELTVTLAFSGASAAVATKPAGPRLAESDQPAPEPAAEHHTPAGVWVGLAVAGAGVLVGGGAALLASHKKSSISSSCPDNVCSADKRSDANAYNSLLTVSTVSFIAAGVGLATAGTFWLAAPRKSEHGRYVRPWLGVASAGVVGAF